MRKQGGVAWWDQRGKGKDEKANGCGAMENWKEGGIRSKELKTMWLKKSRREGSAEQVQKGNAGEPRTHPKHVE